MARPRVHPDIQIGQRFGRYTVIANDKPTKRHGPRHICKCDCGTIKSVVAYDLHSGNTRSCGCLGYDNRTRSVTTHGQSRTPTYNIWCRMRKRCKDITSPDYPDYGGRGITVCERWQEFENFLADMGERPSPSHSIDRRDNDGPYSPENCRWATLEIQANNKRSNHLITYQGRTLNLTQWVKELAHLKMTKSALEHRLERGWPIEEIMTTPVTPTNRRRPSPRNDKGQFVSSN